MNLRKRLLISGSRTALTAPACLVLALIKTSLATTTLATFALRACFSVEAKRKKSGFKFLMDSLAQDDADLLVVRQDRAPRLYVLREETLLTLMREAKQ